MTPIIGDLLIYSGDVCVVKSFHTVTMPHGLIGVELGIEDLLTGTTLRVAEDSTMLRFVTMMDILNFWHAGAAGLLAAPTKPVPIKGLGGHTLPPPPKPKKEVKLTRDEAHATLTGRDFTNWVRDNIGKGNSDED